MDVSQTPGNWYKVSDDGQPSKLSELKENQGARDPKYPIAHMDAQTFEIKILNLTKDDSGTYFCGLISVSSDKPIIESNRANLTVTEKANATAKPQEEKEVEEEVWGRKDNMLPLAILGGAGLLLVLVFLCYFLWDTFKRKRVAQKMHEENAPLEEEPPAVTVFTVDYGVLAFPPTESARVPPKRLASEQTEYATIVFPQEGLDKRTKKQRNCPSRAQLN
ncbi:programmed cell death protein 1 [Tiliqua scincoides]|uniref:programmed cell death protein 1 n=1 Tax=Tiliqua scincoides TaxID=71010 RepID=UPI003462A681